MITTPTTFVVGAGASNDYRLPTSVELRMEANRLASHDGAYELIHYSRLCTPKQLNEVLTDLRTQGTASIDEFLFARQDDAITMRVGRALIAVLLANHFRDVRSHDGLGTAPLDWLGYIIGKMQSGAPDCETFASENAKVRFVTFNFDSIIEDRLEKAIRNLYRGAAEARLQQTISTVHGQIIHVHGQLPPLPDSHLTVSSESVDWLSSALLQIRVVLDDIEDKTLVATQRTVKAAEVLCFLGFAYAKENLTRLDLPDAIDHGVDGEPVHRFIFGTAYQMRPGETELVKYRLKHAISLGDESERCRDFLRNHYIFRD